MLQVVYIGKTLYSGICAEIKRDPNVKHAIIAYQNIIVQLNSVAEIKNRCIITEFKDVHKVDRPLETADDVWIIGTPYGNLLRFGCRHRLCMETMRNPCYEADSNFQHYKDERLQKIYIKEVSN